MPEVVVQRVLVVLIKREVDVTESVGLTDASNLYVCTFNADGTFSVSDVGKWIESGIWDEGRETRPNRFGHTLADTSDNSKHIGTV